MILLYTYYWCIFMCDYIHIYILYRGAPKNYLTYIVIHYILHVDEWWVISKTVVQNAPLRCCNATPVEVRCCFSSRDSNNINM
jgi:hypothetical protein